MDTDRDAESERERLWQVIEAIGDRNAHFDPEEVERDVAEVLAEVRAEMRAEALAKKTAATPQP